MPKPLIRLSLLLLLLLPGSATAQQRVELNAAQRAWLAQHPVIRVAPDPDFAPFEWFNGEGQYKGIGADYLALVGKRLGVEFRIVHAKNWRAVLAMARKHEVDVLPAAARSPQRDEYLLFTKPHIIVPGVVITSKAYEKHEQLIGHDKKVAVVSGYVWDDLLTHRGVDVKMYRVDDTSAGLELAAMGAVDAMVTDLASATHYIRKNGITNLRVVERRLDQKLELAMAVRKDWPQLRQILDQALASISDPERQTINANWLKLEPPAFWQTREFRYSLTGVMLLLLLIVIWNRTLRYQVNQRTRELKNAQAQLIQAEKMESIGRLAAGVAHEVKNPLAIIQMGTDFLKAELPENDTAGEVLHDMDDAVVRADTVIKGLLDFSRDKQLTIRNGDINAVIERAVHLVGHEMRQRHITLQTDLAPDLPPIGLDNNKLQQVFINLFINAAHAMQKDGEITVRSRQLPLHDKDLLARDTDHRFTADQQVLCVEVADSGPGVQPADLKKLFDPFFTTKPVGEGTGLGLSVSRNIIQLHRGIIDIRNRQGGGAMVLLVFPLTGGKEK